MSDSLRPHARPRCPPTPGVYPNSCPSSQWCHPDISSSVIPFSSCPQPLPASGSFPMSQLFTWGGQSIGVSASASVLPVNTQDWSPLGWTGWISLKSKGLSRVFSYSVHKSTGLYIDIKYFFYKTDLKLFIRCVSSEPSHSNAFQFSEALLCVMWVQVVSVLVILFWTGSGFPTFI